MSVTFCILHVLLPTHCSAALSDWELLATEKNCTVYRKLYRDTGHYQFKVIGRYDDITAKDYLDVQVCMQTLGGSTQLVCMCVCVCVCVCVCMRVSVCACM